MSIRWYKTFLVVSQVGSFAAAAQKIGLTPAAVSTQMSALEEKLRVTLFERGARSITLNTAGRELALRVPELIKLYDNIGAGLDMHSLGGTLTVGSTYHMFAKVLPDALQHLRRSHPHITVRLTGGTSSDLIPKVVMGEFDAAIVSQPSFSLPKNLRWHMLVDEPLVLVTPLEVEVQSLASCLAIHPFIALDRSSWLGKLTHDVLQRYGLKLNEWMEINSLEAIASMVSRGFGVSIIPLSGHLLTRRKQLRIFQLTGTPVTRQVGLVHRLDQAQASMILALRDALAASVSANRVKNLPRVSIFS